MKGSCYPRQGNSGRTVQHPLHPELVGQFTEIIATVFAQNHVPGYPTGISGIDLR
jgi:hypothetical protein